MPYQKFLKRVEIKVNTKLFDRVGRNIQLNAQGKKFNIYAINLIHEYEQMCSEFTDNKNRHVFKLSGPSVLLEASLSKIIPSLPHHKIEMSIEPLYEGDAFKHLINGQSHIALVTEAVMPEIEQYSLNAVELGSTTCRVIASKTHEIFNDFPQGKVTMHELLRYSFICPTASPYCGIERGVGSDGWHDHKYPRAINFRSHDVSSLLSVVYQGVALAYVADAVIDLNKVSIIEISDVQIEYKEHYYLIYRRSAADGWLNQLVSNLKNYNLKS